MNMQEIELFDKVINEIKRSSKILQHIQGV